VVVWCGGRPRRLDCLQVVLGQWPASAAEVAGAGDLLPGLLAAVPAEVAIALRITELLRI
jgi:hypothetical protein